jgi:CheY-like chemotaxis protein
MTLKLLIIDPDITFAITIKRALDQTGDFKVTVFGTGSAGTEYLREDPQDVVVVDYNVADVSIAMLIRTIRSTQPLVPVIVTPRNQEQQNQVGLLDVQGSILKPYYARQLIPVVRDATAGADQRPEPRPERIKPTSGPVSTPVERTVRPEASYDKPATPALVPPNSPDFEAAIASLPNLIVEPPISPDDTFRRHLAAMLPEKPATPAGLRKVLESVELSAQGMSAEATIADVVSGKPLTDPAADPDGPAGAARPANVPEAPADPSPVPEAAAPSHPTLAEAALDALDTMPMQGFTLEKFTETIEQTSGMPVPDWVRDAAEQTASFEPSFVKAAVDAAPPSTASLKTPTLDAAALEEPAAGEHPHGPADASAVGPQGPVPEGGRAPLLPTHEPLMLDPLAQIAATLTQLAVGSAAHATLLTHGETVLAAAGDLPADTARGIARVIARAWRGGEGTGNTLVRYITVPGMGDFLLYSAVGMQGTWLSMLFPSETPLRAIRKHARALLDALDKSDQGQPSAADAGSQPDGAEMRAMAADQDTHEAAQTLLSRPTDLRPPEGLRQVVGDATGQEAVAAAPAVPLVLYSVLLAPRAGMFNADEFPLVPLWLTEACLEHGIHVEGVEAQPTFMTFQVGLGPTDAPNLVIRAIMDSSETTAKRTLWADGYYIASSNRALTQQEITQFLKLQKAG